MKYSYFGIMKKDYPIDNDYLCSMWPDYIVMTVCINQSFCLYIARNSDGVHFFRSRKQRLKWLTLLNPHS